MVALILIFGKLVGALRAYIKRAVGEEIDVGIGEVVKSELSLALAPISAQLSTITINQAALSTEVGRIHDLDTSIARVQAKLDNGINDRLDRIENKTERIVEQMVWDGGERRS